MSYLVYMLRCADGTLYTGITTDLERRLAEHNGTVRGARYTRSRRPVELAYEERCTDLSSALKREIAIKHLTRRGKIALIHSATCTEAQDALECRHMAKRPYVDIRQKKSRSHKTKKRLAVKSTMLAAKKAKKRR